MLVLIQGNSVHNVYELHTGEYTILIMTGGVYVCKMMRAHTCLCFFFVCVCVCLFPWGGDVCM